ncbi:MAG: hypothetical protein H0X33_09625 [Taibaiella sp.]|nr:hypothetical protein [Taibaiella sp.]
MKLRPSLVLVMAIIVMAGMSSCVRKYTCQCQVSYTGQPGLPDSTVQTFTITDTKSKAQSECESNSKTIDQAGIHTVEACHIY